MSRGMFLSVCPYVCAGQTSCLSRVPLFCFPPKTHKHAHTHTHTHTHLFCTVTLWQITDMLSLGHAALCVCARVCVCACVCVCLRVCVVTDNPPTVSVWQLPFLKELKEGGSVEWGWRECEGLDVSVFVVRGFINKDDLSRSCSGCVWGLCFFPFSLSLCDSLIKSN